MAMKHKWLYVYLILSVTGCTTVQHISKTDVQYTVVESASAIPEDEKVSEMIVPYKSQLDAVMNEVLVVLPAEISKKKPESPLGNLVSDVVAERLRKEGYAVDFAVINYGGLRVPYLSAGPLTRGEIFELTPFDNTLMVVDVPGTKLDSFLLLIAQADGWPVSREARLVISNKKIVSAQISGQPIDPAKIYKLATIDYVANGGDNMKVLIPLTRKETGIIFRDVLIDYMTAAGKAGKEVTPSVDGRIIQQ